MKKILRFIWKWFVVGMVVLNGYVIAYKCEEAVLYYVVGVMAAYHHVRYYYTKPKKDDKRKI